MTFTPLTPQVAKGPYVVSPGALALALTFAASDNVNGNSFPATGKEVVIVFNSDTVAQTVTFLSVADSFGRTSDITAYSIPAAGYAMFSVGQLAGWAQTDGTIHINSSAATLKLAVVRIP